MKKKAFNLVLVFLICMSSCSDELDFDQVDSLEITPTFESSVIFVEATEQIINLIGEPEVFVENFEFDAFSSDVFSNRVIEGELTYVIQNTTSKPFEILIEFLNAEGVTIDFDSFNIATTTSNFIRTVSYGNTGRDLDIIRTLSALKITARNLGDNISVSDIPNSRISLQISGKFRVRLK